MGRYIHLKFENLKKDFIDKSLDNSMKSVSDYINTFLDMIDEAQTGILTYPFTSNISNYNDILNWDKADGTKEQKPGNLLT